METMMGVKQGVQLSPELSDAFQRLLEQRPSYKPTHALLIQLKFVNAYRRIDTIVNEFFAWFNPIYEEARWKDFEAMGFQACAAYYRYLFTNVLGGWWTPLVNDFLVMSFFGTLKKMTSSLLSEGDKVSGDAVDSLQNDLLCGQGDVESAEPTKWLMRLAQYVDESPNVLRPWFLEHAPRVTEALQQLAVLKPCPSEPRMMGVAQTVAQDTDATAHVLPLYELIKMFWTFLDRFGSRCVNELKLEEKTLMDDPGFPCFT